MVEEKTEQSSRGAVRQASRNVLARKGRATAHRRLLHAAGRTMRQHMRHGSPQAERNRFPQAFVLNREQNGRILRGEM
ncbi:hypothetical protein WBG83_04865 [Paenibacillus sp. y28]